MSSTESETTEKNPPAAATESKESKDPSQELGLLARPKLSDDAEAGVGERDLLRSPVDDGAGVGERDLLGGLSDPEGRSEPVLRSPGDGEDAAGKPLEKALEKSAEKKEPAGAALGKIDPVKVPADQAIPGTPPPGTEAKAEAKPEAGEKPDDEEEEAFWAVPQSARGVDDPLLGCLTILCTLLDRSLSSDALTAGLPLVEGNMTPELFIRAAERAGISSRLMRRQLGRINRMSLPCILLLDGQRACVLTDIERGASAEIVMPEMGAGTRSVPFDELAAEYAGYALFARPEFQFDTRASEGKVADPRGWFWGTLLKSWRIYIEVVLAAIVVNSFGFAGPLFIMNVYDRVVPNFAEETLWVLAIGVLTVFGFEFVLKMLRSYFVDIAGKTADTRIAARLFEQVLGMKMAHRPPSAGALASNLREFDSLRDFFTSSTMTAMVDLPFVFLFIFIVFLVGGPVAIVPLVAVPLVIIVGALMQIPLKMVVAQTAMEGSQKHAILVEAITGIETIKSTAAESRMQRNWETFCSLTARSGLKAQSLSALAMNFSASATQVVTVGVVVFGVYLIQAGELSVGGLVASTMLSGRAMAPLGAIAAILTRFNQARSSLQGLDNMMKTPVERPEGKVFVHRPNFAGQVDVKDVTFSYPNQKVPALDDISFHIEAGEKIAIIGRIGSGKSTIERLLLGLYDPDEGAVMIDGVDVRQVDPADLRRNIGVVPQDVTLFFGSVKENIAFSAPFADDAMILRAARLSGADEFIKKNPAGFDMEVGERGQNLSGGQRQAVAVARAVLLDPPILLMDEPTSSMDNTTESRFKARMAKMVGKKTLILITHRGSMLSLVDRLIVMDGGKIVADGPRDQVIDALTSGRIQTAHE